MSDAPPLALVTGGMRRLGAVIAARLAKAGYALALASHSEEGPESGLAELLEEQQTSWHGFVADLSRPENSAKLMAEVVSHFGRPPDLLVNNAAVFGQDGWDEIDVTALESHFAINFFAPILLSAELAKHLQDNRKASIVHILDQRIRNPHGDQVSYTFSKQALAASVRSMASGLADRLRVNGVAPGLVIETPEYTGEQNDRLDKLMPLGKLPSPQSVADAVVYLATAQDVTGQIIFVDGGAQLKNFDRDFLYL